VRDFLLALEAHRDAAEGIAELIEWGKGVSDCTDSPMQQEEVPSMLVIDFTGQGGALRR
jgi:hypothetical protein